MSLHTTQTTPLFASGSSKQKSKSPFGFSLSSHSPTKPSSKYQSNSNFASKPFSTKKKTSPDDDDDYIPYNGPYEPPKPLPEKQRMRDSWGDVIGSDEEGDDEVDDGRPGVGRPGGGGGFGVRAGRGLSRDEKTILVRDDDERVGRTRDRAFSVFSGRTMGGESLAGGPGPFPAPPGAAGAVGGRRSTVSGANAQPNAHHGAQYATHVFNNGNGVGASPIPRENPAQGGNEGYRMSLASLFSTFGVGHREKDRGRDRDRDWDRDRENGREWDRERGREWDRDRERGSPDIARKSSSLAMLPRISTSTYGLSGGGRGGMDSTRGMDSARGGIESTRGGMESVSPWGEDESEGSQYSYHNHRAGMGVGVGTGVEKVYLPPDSEPNWEREYERGRGRTGMGAGAGAGAVGTAVNAGGLNGGAGVHKEKEDKGDKGDGDEYYNSYYNSLKDDNPYLRPNQGMRGGKGSYSSPGSPVVGPGGGVGGLGRLVGGGVGGVGLGTGGVGGTGGLREAPGTGTGGGLGAGNGGLGGGSAVGGGEVSRNNSTSTGSGSLHQHPYATAYAAPVTRSYSQLKPLAPAATTTTTPPATQTTQGPGQMQTGQINQSTQERGQAQAQGSGLGPTLATRLGTKGPLSSFRIGIRGSKLKGSISTPNLRDSVVLPGYSQQQQSGYSQQQREGQKGYQQLQQNGQRYQENQQGMPAQRYQPGSIVRSGSHPQPTSSLPPFQPHTQPQPQNQPQTHFQTAQPQTQTQPQPHTPTKPQPTPFAFPKGKDKWLSAETWCDALLFPRPRLRLKADPSFVSSTSSFLVGGVNGTGQEVAMGGLGAGGMGMGMGEGGAVLTPTSGRIVSPPGSPVGKADDLDGDYNSNNAKGEGTSIGTGAVMSRVLAHSRSLVDLRLRKKSTMEDVKRGLGRGGYGYTAIGGGAGVGEVDRSLDRDAQKERETRRSASKERAPRPRSFAQDDMALPTPVPSLDHVLRENALFTTERAAWAQQASASLGNKRTRSVSRTRSKSLTQKGRSLRNPQVIPQSNLEYLAARACLGTQNLTPKVGPMKAAYLESQTTGTGTTTTGNGRGMHSHNNSLAKTMSGRSHQHSRSQSNATGQVGAGAGGVGGGHRRSQSYQQNGSVSGHGHGHGHSRGDSWSRSAVKMAKSTVAMCVPSVADPNISPAIQPAVYPGLQTNTNPVNRSIDLEGALKRDGTKVIRLADPAHLPAEVYTVPRLTPSPVVSAHSGSGHGHLAVPGAVVNDARLSLNGVTGSGALGYAHAYAYNSSSSGHGHDHESRMGIAIGGPSPTPSGTTEDDGSGRGRGGNTLGVGLGIAGTGGTGVVSYESAVVDHEGETRQGEVLYVPGHPYAQGGFSFGGPSQTMASTASNAAAAATPSAANPPVKEASKVPTIDEIITRHKAALPHLPLHPYALGARDSYLEAYGMMGQYRHGANAAHGGAASDDPRKKMWAQLSPSGVHEILSPEIKQYSPYANLEVGSPIGQGGGDDVDGKKREVDLDTVDQRTIHDTLGVGEALVNATRPRGARERGSKESSSGGGVQPMPMPMPAPVRISDSITHTYAASPFHQVIRLSPDDIEGEGQSLSITPRSGLSSRILGSPNDLEGFQDLFYRPPEDDDEERRRQTPRENALPDTPGAIGGDRDRDRTDRPMSESPMPWTVPGLPGSGGGAEGSREGSPALHSLPPPPMRRTDSGLTSLARHLNEEFEQIALEREQMGARYSRSPSMSLSDAMLHSRHGSLSAIAPLQPQQYSNAVYQQQHQSRQDSMGSASVGGSRSSSRGMTLVSGEPSEMQFIFEETSSGTNMDEDGEEAEEERRRMLSPIQAFMPSSRNLPEDVHSSLSREEGSSVGHGVVDEEDDDPTAIFRVGIIGSVSTPPPVSPEHHRSSFNAEMHDVQQAHRDFVSPATRARILSNLTAPLTDMTRSSYMTTSTLSRMSGLSDFPVPPSKSHLSAHQATLTTPAATSLLTSYFDEAHYQRETEAQDIPEIPRPPASLLEERQLTFGGNQDADELVKSLSGGALPSSDEVVPTISTLQK